jgi:lactam utilization protein B
VSALNGETVELGEVHTVCIHGDTLTAVELARNLRTKLKQAEIEVKPVGTFL